MSGPRLPANVYDALAAAAARADLATATAQVRLARRQRIPDVTVSAAARRLEASNDVAGVFRLSVPLPLFNNGRAAVDPPPPSGNRRTPTGAWRCSTLAMPCSN